MRVIDTSTGVAGRYCAQLLVLHGADVIQVELGPAKDTDDEADGFLARVLDRGKSVVTLDAAGVEGRERFFALLRDADVLIDDAGPAGLGRFGLDDARIAAARPALVRTRISEFGLDGPWSAWQGSELVNLAAGGLLFLTGTWDRPPVQLAPHQAQLTTGLLAAIATSAAVYAGGPAEIDLSKQEAVLGLIAPALTNYAYTGVVDAREGTVAGMTRIEHAADTWVYAGPSSPTSADYTTFAAFLGLPALAEPRFATPDARMEHWEEHQALIVPKLRERTAREWVDAAAEWRLTFGHVQTTTDLLACPVLAERQFFADIPLNQDAVRVPLAPYLVNGKRPTVLAAAARTAPELTSTVAADD